MTPLFIAYNRGSGGHFIRALIVTMYNPNARPVITINGNSNIIENYAYGWRSNAEGPDGSLEKSQNWLDRIELLPEENNNIIIPCHVRHVYEIRKRFPESKIIYLYHEKEDLYLLAKAWFVKVLVDEYSHQNTDWLGFLEKIKLIHPTLFSDGLLPWTLSEEQMECFLNELIVRHFEPNEFLKLDNADDNVLQLHHYDVLLPNNNLIKTLADFIQFPYENIKQITFDSLETWHSKQPRFISELIKR